MQTENTQTLLKWGKWVIVLLAIFLGVETLVGLKSLRTPAPAVNVISVSGQAEVVVVPDIATVTFSVSQDAKEVSVAQEGVTKKTDDILAAIKNLGIEDKDVKTADYSIYPKYSYQPIACTQSYCPPSRQVQDGYTVSHTVTVKIRNTGDAGKVLAALGTNGATNISGLTFTTDDPEKAKDEARAKAILDAKAKTKVLSENLGIDLDHIVNFFENSGYPTPVYGMGGGADMKAQSVSIPTVPTGENKVVSNVTLVYEIR